MLANSVADHVPVDDRDPVAGQSDHALDEGLARLLGPRDPARPLTGAACLALVRVQAAERIVRRRMEDDDLPDVRAAEVVPETVNEDALTQADRRQHRAARDPVRLDDERLDRQRQSERRGDDQNQLHDGADRRLPVPAHPPASPAGSEAAASSASLTGSDAGGGCSSS